MSAGSLVDELRERIGPIVELRRDLHAHPELRFDEHRTSDVIARTLEGWGIETHRGIGGTGVVGVLRGAPGGRALGIRADIDALPLAETGTPPYASTEPGRMHACGHDGHIAMLLAAARDLSGRGELPGTVHLVFQPAEEGAGGARAMIDDGLFDRFPMDAMFGAHNWPGVEVGRVAVSPGPVMAAGNRFRIVVRGRGTHGAMPHLGVDPLPPALQMAQAFPTVVSRNVPPLEPVVISTTMIRAGEAVNAVPSECELRGTVRAFDARVLDLVESRMRAIAEHTARAFDAEAAFEFVRYTPALVNEPRATAFAREAIAELLGRESVVDFPRTMGSEDFGVYLDHVPGCFVFIGNGVDGPSLHNTDYDFDDALIPIGGAIWSHLARRFPFSGLSGPNRP